MTLDALRKVAQAGGCAFQVGDQVRKHSGHGFVGQVRCVYTTISGEIKVVVENTSKDAQGLQFIFRPNQLEAAP